MHERTERAIAQLLFVFCCAVPTAITIACVLVTWTPWYHSARLSEIEEHLSRESGLIVEIDDFERISPIGVSLFNVHVYEPETQQLVAEARQIDWTRDKDGSRVVLRQSEFYCSQLKFAWRLIHDRLLCRPEHTDLTMQLAANDLIIRSSSGDETFPEVEATLKPSSKGVQMSLYWLPMESPVRRSVTPPKLPSTSFAKATFIRDRGGRRPFSIITLESGDNDLSCASLADYLEPMKRLGGDATFRGTLQCRIDDDRWMLELGGARFDNIDMNQLCENLPYPVRGTGEVIFDRGQLSPGKRVDVTGTLRMTDGWLGNRLVASLRPDFGFAVTREAFPPDGRDVHFDFAAIRFLMTDPTTISLKGVCNSSPQYRWSADGAALCDGGREIVFSDTRQAPAGPLMASIGIDQHLAPYWTPRLPTPLYPLVSPADDSAVPDGQIPSGRVLRAGPVQGGDENMIYQR